MLAQPISSLNDLATRFASFRGHNMAKAGLELAYIDLLAQLTNQSLSRMIGGTRAHHVRSSGAPRRTNAGLRRIARDDTLASLDRPCDAGAELLGARLHDQ